MKKTLILLLITFIVLSIIAITFISNQSINKIEVKKINKEYETYLNKQILGLDVTSVINKAIDSNTKNEIQKDDKGFFIENNTNSIKVEVIIYNEEIPKTYKMETIEKAGMNGFIDNFNLIDFTCSKIEYHEKTNQVKKIIFEQVNK